MMLKRFPGYDLGRLSIYTHSFLIVFTNVLNYVPQLIFVFLLNIYRNQSLGYIQIDFQ